MKSKSPVSMRHSGDKTYDDTETVSVPVSAHHATDISSHDRRSSYRSSRRGEAPNNSKWYTADSEGMQVMRRNAPEEGKRPIHKKSNNENLVTEIKEREEDWDF